MKNRMHVAVAVDDIMADPPGNEFCLVTKHGEDRG
jgi:hypothetical protein